MQIAVTGKKMEVGQAFTAYASDKLRDHVERFFQHALEAQVTMTKDGHHVITADIHVHAGRGIELRGTAVEMDPHHAFDRALEKMTNQLRRYKNRLTNHHSKAGKIDSIMGAQYILAATDDDHSHEDIAPTVIAEMTTQVPTLSVSEAVMRLELAEAPVLVFKNVTHGGVNVVYRRADGNVGWTDPKGEESTAKLS